MALARMSPLGEEATGQLRVDGVAFLVAVRQRPGASRRGRKASSASLRQAGGSAAEDVSDDMDKDEGR
jgi:hypothetical protein